MTHRTGGRQEPSDRGPGPPLGIVRRGTAGAFCSMLSVLLFACSPTAVPESATSVASATVSEPTSPTTTQVSSADSLNEASTEAEICGRGMIWEAEVTHNPRVNAC
jgi:hypothetical protein